MAYLNTKTSAVFVKVFEKSSEPSPITSTSEIFICIYVTCIVQLRIWEYGCNLYTELQLV